MALAAAGHWRKSIGRSSRHEDHRRDLERQRHSRARGPGPRAWIERRRPTSSACRRSRRRRRRCPRALCEMPGYWYYWHGERAYSGVALHVRRDTSRRAARLRASRLRLREPHRDWRETRRALTVASVYVPNGGKDFPAKMRFLEADGALRGGTGAMPGARSSLRRRERRAHRPGRAPQGAQAARHRPAAGGAGALRAHPRAGTRRRRARRSIPTTTASSPGGRRGATCAQRNIGWRIDYVLASARARRAASRRAGCWPTSARATTRRSWRLSSFPSRRARTRALPRRRVRRAARSHPRSSAGMMPMAILPILLARSRRAGNARPVPCRAGKSCRRSSARPTPSRATRSTFRRASRWIGPWPILYLHDPRRHGAQAVGALPRGGREIRLDPRRLQQHGERRPDGAEHQGDGRDVGRHAPHAADRRARACTRRGSPAARARRACSRRRRARWPA